MKTWKTIFYIFAILPWTFIISLMTFYFKAEKVLGYFPHYNQPDPKTLSLYGDFSPIVNWTAGIWVYSFFGWVFFSIFYIVLKRKNVEWKPIIVSGIGQFCGIFLLFSGITEWYFD